MLHFNMCNHSRSTWHVKEKLSYFLVQQAMGIMHFALRSRNSYIYIYTYLHFYGKFCAEFAYNHREGRLCSYESTLNTSVVQSTQTVYSLHVGKIYTCARRDVRICMSSCFINNKGRHLFTGKCGRRDIIIRDLQTIVCTWELEELHWIFFFLGKEIPFPSKFVIILIKVKPRMKLHLVWIYLMWRKTVFFLCEADAKDMFGHAFSQVRNFSR